MRCIFCLKEGLPSKEHVFPEAIGGVFVIQRVCKTCNHFLGTNVDAPLSGSPPVLMRRFELKLAGTKVPDPLRKIFGTGVLAGDQTQKIKARVNPITGKPDIELIYNKTQLEDGTVKIAVDTRRVSDLPKIIQKIRTDAGLLPLEKDELKRVVESAQISVIENPEVLYTIKLFDFRRGIFKIAYELAFNWLGEDYLADPMAAKLRDVILGNGKIEIIRSVIDQSSDLFSVWEHEKNAHIAFTSVNDDDIIINIRLFDVLFAAIVVSEMKDHYIKGQQDPRHVRFIFNEPVNKYVRESSLIDECGRIARLVLANKSNS